MDSFFFEGNHCESPSTMRIVIKLSGGSVYANRLFQLLVPIALVLFLSAAPIAAADPPVVPAELDLTPWKGRVVLVDFWASWCGPCQESFPWMGEISERYEDDGLTIVAVNLDQDPEAAEAFLAEFPAGFHHILDPEGKIAEAFGISVMPSSVLFDRDGNPVYLHEGFHARETQEYEKQIVALLEGREDPTRAAVSLGKSGRRGLGVRPWERGLLADDAMRLDADLLDLSIDDHIYFSKEASSGGRGFGGGGCGCN
jgi:cytochrome c biogenesis protein CcmG/thiol:disulfide interchange protein DsbE